MEPASRHVVVILDGAQERREARHQLERQRLEESGVRVPLCGAGQEAWPRASKQEEELAAGSGGSGKVGVARTPSRPFAASRAQVAQSQVEPEKRRDTRNKVHAEKPKQQLAGSEGRRTSSCERASERARSKLKWSVGGKVSLESELRRIEMHEALFRDMQQQLVLNLQKGVLPGDLEREQRAQYSTMIVEHLAPLPSAAIECRKLNYQVGLGAYQKRILHDLSMSVPEGAIYGLLGPSGCGKTTLLRCVAGRLKAAPGSHLRVFGFRPNERGSQIPGPAIGYMPQEVSIYEEFSVRETLTYFGRLNRMPASILKARIDFLLRFLSLPANGRRLIKTLSGGQQRRVSLAVALVHAPPLLILDEPTVGVDPLLRQVIWNYLLGLAGREKTTIVITTHYIEEARQAHMVGMMRNGRLLAENEPNQLMRLAGSADLESVFLKLCVANMESDELAAEEFELEASGTKVAPNSSDKGHKLTGAKLSLEDGINNKLEPETGSSNSSRGSLASDLTTNSAWRTPIECAAKEDWRALMASAPGNQRRFEPMRRGQKYEAQVLSWRDWCSVLLAITWKNFLRLRRNPAVLVFEFLLPAFQIVLFGLCIGGPPFDIPLAVVNEELAPSAGRLFLGALDAATFSQEAHANLSSALESVRAGRSWAAVHIPRGYTQNLNERLLHPAEALNETILNGTITIYPDLTNLHLALAIEGAFKEAFVSFARNSLELLGYDPQLAELPVRMGTPIYGGAPGAPGTPAPSGYLNFMAPGVVISITYVMATGLTALAFILEKRDGLLERSQMAGVSSSQILLAHAILQVLVMALQIALVLAVTFLAFQVPSEGPLWLVAALVLLQGCAGMAFGLLISALCREENAAIMMLVGTFYINLILAGIMWPIEAMPKWLRPISYAQPQTLPIVGLRDILARGWSLEATSVQVAFLTSIGWLLVFLVAAGLCMRHIR